MATIVQCNCGAEYRRTEEKFLVPHTGDAVCTVCGAALESWREKHHHPTHANVDSPEKETERQPPQAPHVGSVERLYNRSGTSLAMGTHLIIHPPPSAVMGDGNP